MKFQLTRSTCLFLLALVTACASGKSAQRGTAADPAASDRGLANRSPASARATRSDLPAATASAAPVAVAAEWAVTSIKGKFLSTDTTSARVYLDLTIQRPEPQPGQLPVGVSDFTEHFIVNYVLYPDYTNRERLGYGNVALSAQNVFRGYTDDSGDHLVLFFDVKRPASLANALLLTEITETSSGKKSLNDLPIRFAAPRLLDRFALFDAAGQLPKLRNFVTVNDTIVIRDVAGTSKPLHVVRYRHEFDPASSPMNLTARPAPKALAVDSTLTVMTNQPFRLPAEGLYFFQDDTTQTNGMSLLVGDDRYPRLTRAEKLVKPVLYMSTSQETNELTGAPDLKKALDRYWLSLMAGNEDVARRAIKTYYKHVEDANRLFTTYKEGWKTDKGMIYIIMGAPDRVQRSRDREVWVYTRRATTAELNFTFNKRPNQFVEDHYELVRYAEFQPVWYPIVESWRNGAIHE
ncbi:MAG: GWxTD domain-containing protein [Bacteroidetes bacterium]|nr:GWxTD domain-containing protein [Fibrella sp.]